MAQIITTQAEVTPAWLTEVLSESQVLTAGRVINLNYASNDAFNSSVGHYELIYSSEANPEAPQKVVVKLNEDEGGENEVALYLLAMAQPQPLTMLIPCYGAAYDAAKGTSYIVLKDLSDTHAPPANRTQIVQGRAVLPEPIMTKIIEAIAEFHAYWWQSPEFKHNNTVVDVRWYQDKAHFEAHLARREREYAQFKAEAAHEVPAEVITFYDEVFARLPQLWESHFEARVLIFKNLTITTGDSYLNQFLCPKDKEGVNDRTYLMDFQDAGVNFGPFDLAYLMASFWTPAQRHHEQLEEKMLRRYLAVLHAHGVKDYDWQDLLTDYKLMITFVMLIPIWDETCGSGKTYWWPKMQCLIANYQDLHCEELFKAEPANLKPIPMSLLPKMKIGL